jgi:hypothetical protein
MNKFSKSVHVYNVKTICIQKSIHVNKHVHMSLYRDVYNIECLYTKIGHMFTFRIQL